MEFDVHMTKVGRTSFTMDISWLRKNPDASLSESAMSDAENLANRDFDEIKQFFTMKKQEN